MKPIKLNFLVGVGLVLLFGFAFGWVGHAFGDAQFIRGDADGDCLIGLLDINSLICYYFNGVSLPCYDAGDVNDEGDVDLGDIVYLIDYMLKNGPPPPPPFPNPGSDPTLDTLGCITACASPTPSSADSLIVPPVQASAGETTSVPLIVENVQNVMGYQVHLEFDSTLLRVTGVDTIGTATDTAGASCFAFSNPRNYVDIVCTIDCAHSVGIPAGRHTLVKVKFLAAWSVPCTTTVTVLDLTNAWGPPFRGNLLDYNVGNVYPILADGNFASDYLNCGDVDGNGLVELGDVVYLITYQYKNGPPPKPKASGDCNCDGVVGLGDVVYLITYQYKGGPPPCGH
jgi:hypothetical protein